MFKVVGYTVESGWNLCGVHRTEINARAAASSIARDFQIVAVVLVRDPAHNPHMEVIQANVPHSERLLDVAEFRTAALAL
ncbi:hypothetical protein VT84_33040 [Gemmata sp. SH-PL17]|uniref:hypothetical protein n=1 Tax=Gemmata sp. SH-PL17 TaxID=1630693 RepID=UPI00078BF667|nr:hypothetical protein [Gemmata sp. SH-PL17]AMV29268.1 hypothetical protein VT84_33040 [Gemmata sp. SH-PL17]